MKCPICNDVDLLMTERQTVEIDYCPKCRGIWLDRGELEKIIERSQAVPPQSSLREGRQPYEYDEDDYHEEHHDYGNRGNQRRRRGFLGDMFDF